MLLRRFVSEVLLTGATGLLGRELALRLARGGDVVHLLVRRSGRRAARTWVSALRGEDGPLAGRLRLVGGDLTQPGVVDERSSGAISEVDRVVHAAATTAPRADRAFAWQHNVRGTDAMLELAASLPKLRRFLFVSDAAVSGDRVGPFGEDELLAGQRFDGPYGESKMVAERHVRRSAVPWTVVRPSALVASEPPSRPRPIDDALRGLRRLAAAGVLAAPAGGRGRVDVVSAAWVAEAIAALLDEPKAEHAVLHLSDPDAPDLAGFVRAAGRALGVPAVPLPLPARPWLRGVVTRAVYEPTSAIRLLRPLGLEAPPLDSWLPGVLAARTAR